MNLEVTRTAIKNLCNVSGTACKKSCNLGGYNCCYQKTVSVVPEQADIIFKKMIDDDIEINFNKLVKRVMQKDLKLDDLKCLFLDDENNCKIYNDRPIVCIKHNSVNPSINCDPNNKLNAKVLRNNDAEALAFSAFELKGYEDLSKSIYKRIIEHGNSL